jgi:hypothetical protein
MRRYSELSSLIYSLTGFTFTSNRKFGAWRNFSDYLIGTGATPARRGFDRRLSTIALAITDLTCLIPSAIQGMLLNMLRLATRVFPRLRKHRRSARGEHQRKGAISLDPNAE